MARKRYSDEDALKILREIDVHLHDGLDVVGSCRKAGIEPQTRVGRPHPVNNAIDAARAVLHERVSLNGSLQFFRVFHRQQAYR